MDNGKGDAQIILNAGISHAEHFLKSNGEFYPLGVALTPEGDVIGVAGFDGNDNPTSNEVIDLVTEAFKVGASKNEYIATALVYDVQVNLENGVSSDALLIELDHKKGYSSKVILPYKLSTQEIEYGEISIELTSNRVFND